MDAAVEDKHALADVSSALLQVRVATPEALQQLRVHVLPADLNGHVELQQREPSHCSQCKRQQRGPAPSLGPSLEWSTLA